MTSLTLDQKDTNTDSSLYSKAVATASPSDSTLHALVNTAVAGSGNATSRLYTSFTPETSGTYDVAAEYFRNGDMYGGKGTISVFVNSDFGGPELYPIETITSGANGTVTRSTTVDLDSDTTYKIGFNVYVTGNTVGSVSIADFYNSISLPPGVGPRHRVVLKNFRLRDV